MSGTLEFLRIEQSNREVQIVFNGVYIVKTSNPLLVWERANAPPQYYVPVDSVTVDHATTAGNSEFKTEEEPGATHLQSANVLELLVNDRRVHYYVFNSGPLKDYARFKHEEMDIWFEDGALLRTFPKNPSRRIDTAFVAANIRVSLDQRLIAEADHAIRLYESGTAAKYYLPATSILDWTIIKDSDHVTACPYKGEAKYFNIALDGEVQHDAIWYYPFPLSESAAIAGKISFASTDRVHVVVVGVRL